MSWNYRIMKREISDQEVEFGIYEVHYNEKGEVQGYSADSMTPTCGSEEDLKYELKERMLKAFQKETLVYKEDE